MHFRLPLGFLLGALALTFGTGATISGESDSALHTEFGEVRLQNLAIGKTYSVTRNAMIPRLVPADELVTINSRLALAGTVVGGIGASLAASILVMTSPALRGSPLNRPSGARTM